MKRTIYIAIVGLALIVAAVAITKTIKDNKEPVTTYTATSIAAPIETPATPERVLTPEEQTFVDQSCSDSVNQKMYDICKQAFLDTF